MVKTITLDMPDQLWEWVELRADQEALLPEEFMREMLRAVMEAEFEEEAAAEGGPEEADAEADDDEDDDEEDEAEDGTEVGGVAPAKDDDEAAPKGTDLRLKEIRDEEDDGP